MPDQQLVMFRTTTTGVFGQKRTDNLAELNVLLQQGWRVVMMSPTSSPATDVGAIPDVYCLILLERGGA